MYMRKIRFESSYLKLVCPYVILNNGLKDHNREHRKVLMVFL